MKTIKCFSALILTVPLIFSACDSKGDNDSSEIEFITKNNTAAEGISTEDISNIKTENSGSENVSENVTDTETQSGFDGAYEKSLLLNGYWVDVSGAFYYKFNDDNSYKYADMEDNERGGNYSFTGSDAMPIIVFASDDNSSFSYYMDFPDNRHLKLSDRSGNTIMLQCSEKDPSENNGNNQISNGSRYIISTVRLSDDVFYPVLSDWSLTEKQEEINKIFYDDQNNIVNSTDSTTTYTSSVEVKYNDDKLLSIVESGNLYSEGAAHPEHILKTYNIDMETGDILKISDAADINTIAQNLINKENCYIADDSANVTLDDVLDFNEYSSQEEAAYTIESCNNFYFDQNRDLCIYMPVSYAAGGYAAVVFKGV